MDRRFINLSVVIVDHNYQNSLRNLGGTGNTMLRCRT